MFSEVASHFSLWALASVLSNPLCSFEISNKSLLSFNYSDFISRKLEEFLSTNVEVSVIVFYQYIKKLHTVT